MSATILFVCTGNFCRSPMAEAILKDLLRKDGKEELYQARSAGTWTRDGLTASSLALQAMKELGLDMDSHRSHHLASQDIEAASLIVAMTQDHKEALSVEFPQARDKVFLLSELAEWGHDIRDPSGSDSLALHHACAQEIRELLERGYSRMLKLAANHADDT